MKTEFKNVVWKEGKFYVAHIFGFEIISQKGSHRKYRKPGNPTLTAIVPADRKQIPVGTFKSILRQSGLQSSDFEN